MEQSFESKRAAKKQALNEWHKEFIALAHQERYAVRGAATPAVFDTYSYSAGTSLYLDKYYKGCYCGDCRKGKSKQDTPYYQSQLEAQREESK